MTSIPVLQTERLVLRAHEVADLDAMARLWAHPETVRFTSGHPLNREDVWRRMVGYRGMWNMLGYGYMAICKRESGAIIGSGGVQELYRAIDPSLEGTLEAGWIIAPEAQGKGYAREAMQAVFDWCGQAHPGRPITCIINPLNERSIRLAKGLGFREIARTLYKDAETVVFRRD